MFSSVWVGSWDDHGRPLGFMCVVILPWLLVILPWLLGWSSYPGCCGVLPWMLVIVAICVGWRLGVVSNCVVCAWSSFEVGIGCRVHGGSPWLGS